MTTPELSLNARLAIAFGEDMNFKSCPDYENDSIAAFALLEKAKQDGKIIGYEIYCYDPYNAKVRVWNDHFEKHSHEPELSKAITQALAQLLK